MDAYQEPKNDKMISLIAWLIIGCAIFYLAVFTFERFLNKAPKPYYQISQQVEMPDSSIIGDDDLVADQSQQVPEIDLTAIEQPTAGETSSLAGGGFSRSTVSNSDDQVALEQSLPQVKTEVITVAEKPIAEVSVQSDNIAVAEVAGQVAGSTSEVAVEQTVEHSLARSVLVLKNNYWTRLEKIFASLDEALLFIKAMDFGEKTVLVDVVPVEEGVFVFFGDATSKAESRYLEGYLKVRNRGLKMSIVADEEKQALESARILMEVVNPEATEQLLGDEVQEDAKIKAGSVESFKSNSQTHPYTIQIGSFLRLDRALSLRDAMLGKGFNADIEETARVRVTQYKVLVGNFISRSEASSFATRLSEKEKVPVYVRLVKN